MLQHPFFTARAELELKQRPEVLMKCRQLSPIPLVDRWTAMGRAMAARQERVARGTLSSCSISSTSCRRRESPPPNHPQLHARMRRKSKQPPPMASFILKFCHHIFFLVRRALTRNAFACANDMRLEDEMIANVACRGKGRGAEGALTEGSFTKKDTTGSLGTC